MQSAKMTTLLTLFIVVAITSSFVAAAPTYSETVDENVGNLERGMAEDERQFTDVAEQEAEPAEQQGAVVAQPHCFRICVKWGRFGVCVRWDMKCRRTLNDGEAESTNVQVAEDSVAEQEVQPVVQQEAAARPHCIRICVKWRRFGGCVRWGCSSRRSLNDDEAESANIYGSRALHQENVAEQEVGPVQQDASAAAQHVAFGCRMECKRKVWKGCIDWTWKCRRSLDDQQDATAIVSGSEIAQQADVAEPEVEPVVQEEAVAQSHCTKICIVRDYRGRCFRYYLKCPKRQ